jgi:hypothetical protein
MVSATFRNIRPFQSETPCFVGYALPAQTRQTFELLTFSPKESILLWRMASKLVTRAGRRIKSWHMCPLLAFIILLLSSPPTKTDMDPIVHDHDSHSRSFSTHVCYDGVNETELEMDGHADDPRWRTCMFRNVCFSFAKQKFLYFSRGYSEIFEYPWNTTSGFPIFFANLQRNSDTGGGPFSIENPLAKSARPIPFSLTVIHSAIPSRYLFAQAPAHYLTLPFSTENFGHVLFDLVLPAYQSAKYFRLLPEELQLLVGRDVSNCSKAAQDLLRISFRHADVPFHFDNSLNDKLYFNARPSKVLPRAIGAPSKSDHICFRKLIAGSGRTGLAFGAGPLWTHFIDHIVSRSGVDVVERFNEKVQSLNVLILFKSSNERRASRNPVELRAYLLKNLRVPVRLMYSHELKAMSLREQLHLIMDVAVLVTDAGGMSTLSAFMRPNTASIIVSYFLTPTNSTSRMENLIWRHETRRKVYHFPVRRDEITLMHPKYLSEFRDYMERQWKSGDFWKYRNFGRARIDVRRMLTYVEAALAYVSTTNSI